MTDDANLPSELEELDRSLREIRFAARASFGPELLGRLRRGERSKGAVPPGRRRSAFLGLAASLVIAAGTVLVLRGPPQIVVDRCCYDLDGGGDADDGVLILAQRNARVHRLRVYEDLDGSGSYTAGDLVRLDRGARPAVHGLAGEGIVTVEQCCLDFDGGGPDDDGLLVIAVPPERVVMAAIYERGPEPSDSRAAAGTFPLR